MSVLILAPLVGALLIALMGLGAAGAQGAERTGLHRSALAVRWSGLAVGALAAALVILIVPGPLGAYVPAAGLVASTAAIAVLAVGEHFRPLRSPDRRIGLLLHRSVRSLGPRSAVALLSVTTVALLGLVLMTTVTASPDDRGRAGRVFAWSNGIRGDGGMSGARGPFPGQWYTVPIGIALVFLLTATAVALIVVARRRPSEDPADLLLRRRAAAEVLGTASAGVSCTALMCGLLAASAYSEAALHVSTWRSPIAVVGFWLSIAAVIVGLLGLTGGTLLATSPALAARRGRVRVPGIPARADMRLAERGDRVPADASGAAAPVADRSR